MGSSILPKRYKKLKRQKARERPREIIVAYGATRALQTKIDSAATRRSPAIERASKISPAASPRQAFKTQRRERRETVIARATP